MKFIKSTSTLFAAVVLLFSACSDDNNPAPEVKPEKISLPTKAYYYHRLSDSTVAGMAEHVDSIYYNEKNQIVKIADIRSGSGDGTTIYAFSYNTDGTIKEVASSGGQFYRQRYYFYYRNDRGATLADSIVILDSSALNPKPVKLLAVLTYFSNNKLGSANLTMPGEENTNYLIGTNYYRASDGKLDSVYTYRSDDYGMTQRYMHPSATGSLVNQILPKLGNAYLLMTAIRQSYLLFTANTNNIYLQQFLNPGDNMLNDGVFSLNGVRDQQYKSALQINADSTVKTYQYFEQSSGELAEKFGIKFQYATFIK